jgi:hypothetical protein
MPSTLQQVASIFCPFISRKENKSMGGISLFAVGGVSGVDDEQQMNAQGL